MANWTPVGSIGVTPGTVAPNRSNTAQTIDRAATAAYLSLTNITTIRSGENHTVSLYVKRVNNDFLCVRAGRSLTASYVEASFDLVNGEVGRVVTLGGVLGTTPTITSIGDGWFSISITIQLDIDSLIDLFVTPTDTVDVAVTEAVGSALETLIWNPSFERRPAVAAGYLGSGIDNEISAPLPGTNSRFTDSGFIVLPVFAADTSAVEYTNDAGQIIRTEIDTGNDFNTLSAIRYVTIPQQASHGFPTEVRIFNNREPNIAKAIKISRQDIFEKRHPILISFLNKNGVIEDFWMIRKHVETQAAKSDTYYRNIVDYDNNTGPVDYNTHRHVIQRYNVVNKESVKAETAFIPESQNNFIRELLNSEYVWATIDGRTNPVILKTSNVSYKTHINDKLVQYTFTFDFAHRLDNTIR